MPGFDEEMAEAMGGELDEEDVDGAGGSEDDEPDEGPTDEELEDAALPDEEEEEKEEGRPKKPAVPVDQQLAQLQQHNQNLLAALSQARNEKRTAKQRAQALERRQQLHERRNAIILQRVAAASDVDLSDIMPPAEQPIPDQSTDPIGYLTAQMERMVAPLAARLDEQEQQRQSEQLDGQVAAVDSYVAEDAAAFTADHPDYDEAENVVLEAIATDTWAKAKAAYPDADEDDLAAHVEQYIGRAIGNLKVGAYRDGKSLASIVYAVAQQHGWQPGGAQQQPRRRRAAGGKVADLRRNLERTGGPVDAGAERAPRRTGPLSLATVENMSDEEFYKLTKNPKDFERLLNAVSR